MESRFCLACGEVKFKSKEFMQMMRPLRAQGMCLQPLLNLDDLD
ncbi:hypothetical protein [Paenibacillus periandrae]|nr:hypothetical protein [Paenibacillus periandrae]